jgi:2-dehydropantoate 2-reductase
MKIAVMAAGGVGGYFGARLAAAGEDVTFIARGDHLNAMRNQGLRIVSQKFGDVHIKEVSATDDPASIGPVDVVLFAVKLWDTETAAKACKPLLGEETAIVSFQNGVESVGAIAEEVGASNVYGGSAFFSGVISEPGVIGEFGGFAKLVFGAKAVQKTENLEALLSACQDANIEASIADDIDRVIWEKFMFLTALSGTTTASRHPIGVIRADPDMRTVFRGAMEEIVDLAAAKGVTIDPGAIDGQMDFIDNIPADMTASTLKDLNAGKRLETPWLSGAVVRMGREMKVATPLNAALNAMLKPYENGA